MLSGVPTPDPAVPRQCPRCAYDLTGIISSWKSDCPVRGTCSECGLEFAWRDVFDDRLSGPPWSFEHAPRWSWRRLALTFWHAKGLGGLWKEIRLEVPIVRGRLVMIPLVVYALYHSGLALAALYTSVPLSNMLAYLGWGEVLTSYILPAVIWPYKVGFDRFLGPLPLLWLGWVGLQWAFMPLLMLILGESMRRVRVRRVHILRGAAYSAVAAAVATLLALGVLALAFAAYVPLVLGLGPVARQVIAFAVAAVPTLWLTAWWYRFLKSYLRLPRAAFVTLTLMGVSLLATVTTLLVVALSFP